MPIFSSSNNPSVSVNSLPSASEGINVTERGVQHAIAPNVASLVGEQGKSTEPFLFVPSSRPIDMKVSDIKVKI